MVCAEVDHHKVLKVRYTPSLTLPREIENIHFVMVLKNVKHIHLPIYDNENK